MKGEGVTLSNNEKEQPQMAVYFVFKLHIFVYIFGIQNKS